MIFTLDHPYQMLRIYIIHAQHLTLEAQYRRKTLHIVLTAVISVMIFLKPALRFVDLCGDRCHAVTIHPSVRPRVDLTL